MRLSYRKALLNETYKRICSLIAAILMALIKVDDPY